MDVGVVEALWRFPVKSTLGERVRAVEVVAEGVVGDRRLAVRGADGKLGSGKSTRRFRRMGGLLEVSARAGADGSTWLTLPDGLEVESGDPRAAAALSSLLGEPVELVADTSGHHLDHGPVHLLTTSSMRWLHDLLPTGQVDARRFRPNLVVDTPGRGRVEEAWVRRDLVVGTATLHVTGPAVRCAMAALAQEELRFAPDVLRVLERENELCLGVYAEVRRPGTVPIGAAVRIADDVSAWSGAST